VYDAASQRDDAEFELVELDDHQLPLLDEPVDAGAATGATSASRRGRGAP
jgi:hypothetical protein